MTCDGLWEEEDVARMIKRVMSPSIKEWPEEVRLAKDGNSNPILFEYALELALDLANIDGKPLLLEALRKKWPEAVAASLPQARSPVEKVIESRPHPARRLAYA
jgi:hypothetical protein